MGTRGAVGFVIKGEEKLAYNHFDSYPEGLGIEVLAFLRKVCETPESTAAMRVLVEALQVVSDEVPPTKAQIRQLRQFADLTVGNQTEDDWYNLLRRTQGDLGAILRAGFVEDGSRFPLDSLFCEWAYVIDLDARKLEVYRGFQKRLPEKGRWAGRPTAEEDVKAYEQHLAYCLTVGRDPWMPAVSEWKAVERCGLYSLSQLPTDENFVRQLNRKARRDDG